MKVPIINPSEFVEIMPVYLNRTGKKIGKIVKWKRNQCYYYLSKRTKEHFFRKFQGFGMDKNLIVSMLNANTTNPKLNMLYRQIEGIIIFYDGVREKRYFYSNLDDWIFNAIPYGTTKKIKNTTETYGSQKVLPQSFMRVIGVDRDDISLKN